MTQQTCRAGSACTDPGCDGFGPLDGGPDDQVPTGSLLLGDSPRINGEDLEHVRVLAASDADFPPILVDRQTMRIIDGMHRLRAALLKGQQTVPVRYFDGSDDEAFVLAVKANTTHGLPLTLADREAAASRILAAQPHRADRWIASTVGLAAGTIAVIRRQVAAEAGSSEATSRMGRDGRVRPLDGTAGRLLASEAIANHPDASLREIARIAGISPATARDVRARLQRGQDPVMEHGLNGERRTPEADRLSPSSGLRRTSRGTPRDRADVMRDLRSDPSLRMTEAGRTLLRWLDAKAAGPAQWSDLMRSAPPHCVYLVAELARGCGNEWLNFAAQLEERLRAMT